MPLSIQYIFRQLKYCFIETLQGPQQCSAKRNRLIEKNRYVCIKFPFKRKGLTSHNVKFPKCLLENNNGQFKVDNKSTILHLC